MTSLERFISDVFGNPDLTILLGDTGVEVTLEQFMELVSGERDDILEVAPPSRSSAEYRDAIFHVTTLDELDRVVNALGILHHDYGWRGPADAMARWLIQIETAPLTQEDRWRDVTGTVDLGQLLVIRADEEQVLRLAADKKERHERAGMPPHLAFQKGLAETEAGIALCQRWLPYFHAALRAAHTARVHHAVLAELFKAPGRTDRDELLKAAMVLATAAYGVRHHRAMTARYEALASGQEASSDPSITPGWDSGGYMSRSALRRTR